MPTVSRSAFRRRREPTIRNPRRPGHCGRAPGHRSSWRIFLAEDAALGDRQRDIVRIQKEVVDYMPGLTSDQKKDKLWRMSYKDYLLHVVKADPGVIPYYQTRYARTLWHRDRRRAGAGLLGHRACRDSTV